MFAVGALMHRDKGAAVLLDYFGVYRNGFMIHFAVLLNPHQQLDAHTALGAHPHPRVGVRFADGQRAGQQSRLHALVDIRKDELGVPNGPFIGSIGSGAAVPPSVVDSPASACGAT